MPEELIFRNFNHTSQVTYDIFLLKISKTLNPGCSIEIIESTRIDQIEERSNWQSLFISRLKELNQSTWKLINHRSGFDEKSNLFIEVENDIENEVFDKLLSDIRKVCLSFNLKNEITFLETGIGYLRDQQKIEFTYDRIRNLNKLKTSIEIDATLRVMPGIYCNTDMVFKGIVLLYKNQLINCSLEAGKARVKQLILDHWQSENP